MTTHRHRVAIAVSPRVFGDALCRVLARDEVEIDVVPERADARVEGGRRTRYDIAIVSGAVPRDISANVVIRLDDGPAGHRGALADLLERVDRLCAQSVYRSPGRSLPELRPNGRASR